MAVASYRLRATFRRRLGGYFAIALLVGMLGGVAMASVAAARRTQSSYPTFLASTNPSDLVLTVYNDATGSAGVSLTSVIKKIPDVRHVDTLVAPTIVPLTARGAPELSTSQVVVTGGSFDGLAVNQDRLVAVQGRLANPARANEVVMTASAAKVLKVRLGQLVPLGLYSHAEMNEPGFGTAKVPPVVRVDARLVGIVVLNNEVLQDDVDQAFGFTFVTAALLKEARAHIEDPINPVLYGLQLTDGDRDLTSVEQRLIGLVPAGDTYQFHVTSTVVTQMELSLKPESVALGAFGAIATLVCLVLGLQAISRQLRSGEDDLLVLRSLGANRAMTITDGLIGVLGAVVAGSLIAALIAVALSPLGPIGPVRRVYPDLGFTIDWTVVGGGLGILLFFLSLGAIVDAYRKAPHLGGRAPATTRQSRLARSLQTMGVPVAGVVGVRFALEPGRGRTSVPVRSALIGTAIAVAMVVATLTFASSLNTLVSHPELYGWNWTYALYPANNVPPQARKLLSTDKHVAAWSGVNYTDATIDNQVVPILLGTPGARVAPPVLSGHGLEANNQIVLGAATLAALHKHVGDTVTISYESPKDAPEYVPPTTLVIVGTSTFPAIGYDSFVAEHTSMGTGALVSTGIQPPAFRRALTSPDATLNGPELVFVRLRAGVSAKAGLADMDRIAAAANRAFAADPHAVGDTLTVLGVLRPAQIVNYRSIGSTPITLSVGLAAGAIIALGLTLATSVRRRRRDLALLKSLGFTQRQLAAAVTWQASVTVLIGLAAGIPIGLVLGRQLWILFARNIDAVPDPTIPALSVVLVGVGAVLFALLDSALPARAAARTPVALALRSE
jgi:hypothetical protein